MLHAPFESGAGEQGANTPRHFVYVIDDESLFRESSCLLISALGLSCVQFPDGRNFLSNIDELEPGCILLDVMMEGMDGLDVQQELLRRGCEWPVIFMSGRSHVPTIVQAVKSGAVEFLQKPFADEELLAALHRGFVKLRNQGEAA